MFKNYLITALRNLKKNKLYSVINILGLVIGLVLCLLILHYVNFERSYDQFHSKKQRIYRMRYERTSEDGSAVRFASCCPPAGVLIRDQLGEVEKLARIFKYRTVVSYKDLKFTEERIFYSEPSFFEIFDFEILYGDPVQILAAPNKTLISQSMAQKYFGNQAPIGKILRLDDKHDYEIAGVLANMPENSHIKMDLVIPWKNLEEQFGPEYYEAWGHSGTFTYLLLHNGANISDVKAKIANVVENEFGEILKAYKLKMELPLQPLTDIHLTSHYLQEYEPNGDRGIVQILSIIALFIIIIAWVNYVNLSTARALTRAREVGLRKAIGANRRQLILQFSLETVFTNLVSIIGALLLIQLFMPLFAEISGIPTNINIWQQHWFWQALAVLFVVGVFLSGAYPILALSSFQPSKVLRGKIGNESSGINLRKTLVVFQFAMALVLIIGTFAVFKQVSFMQHQKLGFNSEQVLVVKAPRVRDDNFGSKVVTFKKALLSQTEIEKICVVTEVPGKQLYWDAGGIMKAGDDISKTKNYYIVGVDYDFIDVFDLQLSAGRGFSESFGDESKNLILNETAVKWMGFKSPQAAVGKQVSYWEQIYDIVGVLKDYHQQSPKVAFEPQIYRYAPEGRGSLGHFAMRIGEKNVKKTVEMVKRKYVQFFPGNPFDFFFLDDYYDQQYQADVKFGRLVGLFSIFAVFVTSLGILGLSTFMTMQRTKEIGIRKALGAGMGQVLVLLTKDFLKLILLAFVITVPIIFWAVHAWLANFANRFDIDSMLFFLPLIFVVLITSITISGHVLRAAIANPVDSLRYE